MTVDVFQLHAPRSTTVRRLVRLLELATVLIVSQPALAEAQVVPGNTGTVTVLAEGLKNPTTVAVRDGIAFVPEGQLARLNVIGGLFTVREIALDGSGILKPQIILPGQDFFPEGISLDPATNDLFVGSIFNGTVVRVPNNSLRPKAFATKAPSVLTRGAFGSRVDDARGLVWVCDSNLGANPPIPGGTVVGLGLADHSVAVRHELPDNSICNDIIIDTDGSLFVTETAVGQVFRIAAADALVPNSAQVFVATPELAPPAAGQFGANGLAIAGGIMFVSNTFQGTLVRLDPAAADPAATISVVNLTEGGVASAILSGPDGVLPLSDTRLLVVENGFAGAGNQRLIQVDLDPQ